MSASELAVIGLTCNLVGVFFLANSIIFRKLRKVIQEFFGVRSRSIKTIKDYTLNNIQVALGFLFLTVGFLLEIYAVLGMVDAPWRLLAICLAIVLLAFGLYLFGAFYSRRSFKKYLRQFFLSYPESFNKEVLLTKEIGEYLGIPHNQDMTVEDYTNQVRHALDLDMPENGGDSAQLAERRRTPRVLTRRAAD